MSPDNREWSNVLNKSLNKWGMRECPLILKARKMDLMPEEVGNIYLPFGSIMQTSHEVDAVVVAGPLSPILGYTVRMTHLKMI